MLLMGAEHKHPPEYHLVAADAVVSCICLWLAVAVTGAAANRAMLADYVSRIFLLAVHSAVAVLAETAHVFIGVGGTMLDVKWVENQLILYGVAYRPVLINPHLRLQEVQDAQRSVERLGGTFYANTAWIADGRKMHLNLSPLQIYQGGLDSVFRVRGRHSTRVNVTSVDLARVMREHTSPGDIVVMRMDVEGAEYELLRHLLLEGLLCRLSRLYLETHAMSHPVLHSFRNFDVVLPWLLAPCQTEVFVDSNYHILWETKTFWPREDGVCRQCPALYAALPGHGAAACPSSALMECFDGSFTCERCCNLRRGPRGDARCWARSAAPGQKGTRLKSGGLGYPLPNDVLSRLAAEAARFPFKQRTLDSLLEDPPPAFSYEMCCAGMLGQLSPELASLVADRNQQEAFSPENPRFSLRVGLAPVAAAAAASEEGAAPATGELPCATVSGDYADSGGGRVLVTQSACEVTALNQLQRWSVAGVVEGETLRVPTWQLAGSVTVEGVSWPNGAVWLKQR